MAFVIGFLLGGFAGFYLGFKSGGEETLVVKVDSDHGGKKPTDT